MRASLSLALLCASLVSSTIESVGWGASIDTANVEFSRDNVGDNQIGLFVTTPLVIQRIFSDATSVVVTGTLRSIGNSTAAEDSVESQHRIVFVETIGVTGDEVTQNAFFDIIIPSPWQNYFVDLSVSIPGTEETAETNGLVITYNPVTDTFAGKTPGTWAHEENVRIIRELELEEAVSREVPQDPSDLGEDPDLPAIDGTVKVDGTPKNSNNTGGGGGGSEGGCDCTTTNAPKKTQTVCPSKRKPTCTDDYRLDTRQVALSPAIIDARITFIGWNGLPQVLRLTRVTAFANVYTEGGLFLEPIHAVKTTDVLGRARFRFDIAPNQRIIVDRLVVRLEGKKYVIGTRLTQNNTLVPTSLFLQLNVNPWYVSAGETRTYENQFPRNVVFDPILVADAMQRLDDYVRINVSAVGTAKIDVWCPSEIERTFFRSNPVYINIPSGNTRNPDVLAHEYGHWLHYQARLNQTFPGGGNHSACNTPKIGTALSEGFATAFGLTALDRTPLRNPVYGGYTKRYSNGTINFSRNYEVFACPNNRTMLRVEGRVTAAIFDLGDRLLDAPRAATDDFANIYTGFTPEDINIRFPPELLFWRALRKNPKTMTQYWGALRALMTPAAEAKAWNVIRYNWGVDIERSPAAP